MKPLYCTLYIVFIYLVAFLDADCSFFVSCAIAFTAGLFFQLVDITAFGLARILDYLYDIRENQNK